MTVSEELAQVKREVAVLQEELAQMRGGQEVLVPADIFQDIPAVMRVNLEHVLANEVNKLLTAYA